jgi:uncharacterized protein (TIGR02265 family)
LTGSAATAFDARCVVGVEKGADGSMFEALLVRALKPNPSLLADLTTLGVNLKSLDTLYPTQTWVKVLDAVRRHHYGMVANVEAAYRQIGKDFCAGYLDTLIGRVIMAAMVFMNPRRLLERAPSYMKIGRKDMQVTWMPEGDRAGRLRYSDPFFVNAGFPLGIFDEVFDRMGSNVKVTVEHRSQGEFDLVFSW